MAYFCCHRGSARAACGLSASKHFRRFAIGEKPKRMAVRTLCNVLFTRELARRLHGPGVRPGFVATRLQIKAVA
jgi:hypothetical protein